MNLTNADLLQVHPSDGMVSEHAAKVFNTHVITTLCMARRADTYGRPPGGRDCKYRLDRGRSGGVDCVTDSL
jgi:hypothetical protein